MKNNNFSPVTEYLNRVMLITLSSIRFFQEKRNLTNEKMLIELSPHLTAIK